MASRTWLAISLACLIWFGYLKWFAPIPPASQTPSQTAPSETVPGSGASQPANTPPAAGFLSAGAEPQAAANSIHTVSTQHRDVDLSAVGGKISQVKLHQYKDSIKKDAQDIRPISSEVSGYSLATLFSDSLFDAGFTNGAYAVEGVGNTYTFTRSNEKGVKLKKQYAVNQDGYTVDAIYTISFSPEALANNRASFGYVSIPVGARRVEHDAHEPLKSWEVVAYQNDKIIREPWDKLEKAEDVRQGTTGWLAFGNRYFSSVIVNQSEINPDLVLTKTPDFTGAYLRYPIVLKAGQNEVAYKVQYYIGPKVVSELSKVQGLKQLVDYGMFSFFAYPLLELLRFFYKFVNNYGIAIILLTLVVRGLFYPLSVKSFKSMKEMQKLQPQIALLKERYKNDPKKLNEEQMALFKTHKVNPMGGCLPMLVQLPVFIALYAVLANSIELFHAPFYGWIHDLSTKDPFYIYPVLMGVAMFIQQKMTPSVGMDPAQQKIMLFMPIMFTFMMISLPAGLTLYIFLSTILGVLQQWSLMKGQSPAAKLATVTPSPSTQK